MRVILINPLFCAEKIPKLKAQPELHLGLITVQTILKECGIPTHIVDFNLIYSFDKIAIDADYYKNAALLIKQKMPDFIGITSMSNNFINAVLLAEELKGQIPNCTIFMGGPHVSLIAKAALEEFPFIDFICRGESEKILPDLAEYFKGKKVLDDILNITYRRNNCVVENPRVNDLVMGHEMPVVNYSDYIREYVKDFGLIPEKVRIEGGRGCPYNCIFCSTSEYWDRRFRFKNTENIICEMKMLNQQHGISNFSINHDLFTCNKKELFQFCNMVKEYNFRWQCSSRADVIDEETLQIMKDSGCTGIFFGIETGDPKTQKQINKNLDLTYADEIIYLCKKLDIEADVSFIIGFPDESIESISNTLSRALKYKLIGANRYIVHTLIPEQGSQLMKSQNELCFEKLLYTKNTSRVCVDEKKELSLIRQNPDLFSCFYYYKSDNFNAFFIESVASLFRLIITYFKFSIYALSEIDRISIIEVLSGIMGWTGTFLTEAEYMNAHSKNIIFEHLFNYMENKKLSAMTRSVYEYERSIFNQIRNRDKKENFGTDGHCFSLSPDVVIGRYKYNIAKFMYGIIKNIGIIIEEEAFSIASKIDTQGDEYNFSIFLLDNIVADFLMNNESIPAEVLIKFINGQDENIKSHFKTLIERGFLLQRSYQGDSTFDILQCI